MKFSSRLYIQNHAFCQRQGAWSSDHVYFLLNKSLVQHITGVCVYILFLEISGPYLVWVHTLFYSQLYTASKWLGNQSNYLGRQCGRVPCTARQTRYPAVSGSSPALTTCWICSRSFKFKSSSTLVNRQLAASCQLGFLVLLCSIWMLCFLLLEWSASKLYLLYLALYTHFINSIISIYAIQPSGCKVLVIKLSVYLSIYLSKQKKCTLHYKQNFTL